MEGRQHIVLDMETIHNQEKEWKKRPIYRAPRDMKKRNPEAYSPQLVSVGPYHHGSAHLMPMERHKIRALSRRQKRFKRSFEDYVNALSPVVEELMDAYNELGEEWKDHRRFLELMVVDGCFFLEIMLMMGQWTRVISDHNLNYSDMEGIFYYKTLSYNICDLVGDLMMIENQLPRMVITRILQMEGDDEMQDELHMIENQLPLMVSKSILGMELEDDEERLQQMLRKVSPDDFHYLDGVRKSFIGTHEVLLPHQREPYGFYCASDLHRVGIVFKRKQGSPVTDITFDGRVLSLPHIPVSRLLGTHMLNMVAFERLHRFPDHEVSAYIWFIARLVRSVDDVKLLKSEGIITTYMGYNEDDRNIVEFIHKLDHDMNYIPWSCYPQQRAAMYEYYENNTKKWKWKFHTYFRNPWFIVSLLLAGSIILLELNVLVGSKLH